MRHEQTALRSLSLPYPKKDWGATGCQSFFGYDNDKDVKVCFVVTHVKYYHETSGCILLTLTCTLSYNYFAKELSRESHLLYRDRTMHWRIPQTIWAGLAGHNNTYCRVPGKWGVQQKPNWQAADNTGRETLARKWTCLTKLSHQRLENIIMIF